MKLTTTLAATLLLSVGGLAAAAAPAVQKTTVKLATLVPEGSVWDKAFRKMGSDWAAATDGRVQLRIYGGGMAGDEDVVVRKMRIGQLNAASLTTSGLGEITDAYKLFEVPLFFQSVEEVIHVLEKINPILEAKLEEKGFVLLGYGHTGWVHFFSTEPIEGIDDLRRLKQFVWGGSNRMVQWWKENGFKPVALAATDIMPALQTGMVESIPATPLTTLSLQWFRQTPYMTEMNVMPFLGGTVISKKVWDKLSPEDQKAMREAAAEAEAYLFEEVPRQEREAIAEMEERGLTVVSQGDGKWVVEAANSFREAMRGIVPSDILDVATEARDAYRAKSATE